MGYSSGPICTDTIRFEGGKQTLKAEDFMFFIQTQPEPSHEYYLYYDGIMGLAPRDEASGPLLLEYLYD